MKILHILSSDFYSGAVAYVSVLVKKQLEDGHEILIMTDNPLNGLEHLCITVPVSNRKYKNRIKNVAIIKELATERKIDVVHAHSRAASWVAYYAVRRKKIAMVSSIHGIQKKTSRLTLKRVDVYGDEIICICKNLAQQLINEVRLSGKKISVIHNGIDNSFTDTGSSAITLPEGKKTISVIGRFNGPKGQNFSSFICNVFPLLLEKYEHLSIRLIGPEWGALPEEGKAAFSKLSEQYKDRIIHNGYTKDVKSIMLSSDLIIGGGRVAIEALMLKKAIFAIGEAEMHGLLGNENIQDAIDSNFGDIKPGIRSFEVDAQKAFDQIDTFLKSDESPFIYNHLSELYSIESTSKQIELVYQKAISGKK